MVLSDSDIARLVAERKPEQDPEVIVAARKEVERHLRHSVPVKGQDGSRFDLTVPQSTLNPRDFSVILTHVTSAGRAINLLRFNGSSHPHRNAIEGDRFAFVSHIHRATERYQRAGYDAEGYAVPTDDFTDLVGALYALLAEAHFDPPAQGAML